MVIRRKFENVDITVNLTFDEVVGLINNMSIDERKLLFKKLFKKDIENIPLTTRKLFML